MAFLGMDVDTAQHSAAQLQVRGVDAIEEMIHVLDFELSRLMEAWHGVDAVSFDNDGAFHHRPRLIALHNESTDVRSRLSNNIAEPIRTSRLSC